MTPQAYLFLLAAACALLALLITGTRLFDLGFEVKRQQERLEAQLHVFKILGVLQWSLETIEIGIPKFQGEGDTFARYKRATQKFHTECEGLKDTIQNMEKKWSPLWNPNINLEKNTLAAFHEEVDETFYLIEESFKYHRDQVEILRLALLESNDGCPITVDTTAAGCLKTAKKILSDEISA